MARYRTRPVEVEAWQVGSDEPKPEWVRGYLAAYPHMEDRFAGMGPWLVLGRIGIVTLYTRHQFEDEYELVSGREAGLAIEDLIRKIEADGVDAVDLKPCPFHEDPIYPKAYVRHDKGNGHPDSGGWSATVECPDCGASMSESECLTAEDAFEGAAEAWNTRHERTCEVVSSHEIPDEYERYVVCTVWTLSCGHEAITAGPEEHDPRPCFCPNCGAKVVG